MAEDEVSQFWSKNFKADEVKLADVVDVLNQVYHKFEYGRVFDIGVYVIDPDHTKVVDKAKFQIFVRRFGPLNDCLTKADDLFENGIAKPWFHGLIEEKFLELGLGEFAVRFSNHELDGVVLQYGTLKDGKPVTKKISLKNTPKGYEVKEVDEIYPTISACIHAFKTKGKITTAKPSGIYTEMLKHAADPTYKKAFPYSQAELTS